MNESVVRIVKKKRQWYESKQAKEKPKIEYYPAPGARSFKYKGKTLWAFSSEGKV
jgi:hypothetical protein